MNDSTVPAAARTAHPMRRARQQLDDAQTLAILQEGSWGTLALVDDDGMPYAVPVNYVWLDCHAYFHCALHGHKLDALTHCDRVCFTVVASDDVLPQKFTTLYRSAMVFGTAHVVADEAEKLASIDALGRKFMAPGDEAGLAEEMKAVPRMHMVRIDPQRITGKQAIELLRRQEA